MSETYHDHLDYLPEKEREAAEQALYINEESGNLPMMIMKQINRTARNPEKPRKNVYKQF